ncbi:hypothetical protein HJC23_012257 [Cyclotella cryptica]|uniref:Uncharacterized protein n=1 Tax=Cyclotella cryptica TaxID=29204 RepID=A0ABD3PMZ7_9STRA|eukprot:CCRYP_013189-RA/>CCRYP_013189-RA protein AED:0.34 eAED:0.34 QI:0/-1/0/1/-1/1/1/0/307
MNHSTSCKRTNKRTKTCVTALVLSLLVSESPTLAFVSSPQHQSVKKTLTSTQLHHWANRLDRRFEEHCEVLRDQQPDIDMIMSPTQQATRRSILSIGVIGVTLTTLLSVLPANADFAPGGTLLDRTVSVTYGNSEASLSRAKDNSNVLFNQDNYYKFGAAAQWIEPGSTDFPKTMPFVPSQQRYEALKKYGGRVKIATDEVAKIGNADSATEIPEASDPVYQLRALGLLANAFLASENTGTTNELMLARWYINEVYLRIGDMRAALEKGDRSEAKLCHDYTKKAMNSYLSLMNRVITSKVGEPFGFV